MSYRLGRKIEPEVIVVGDEWEPFKSQHGTNMERNRRTGQIKTAQEPKGPQYPDPYQHMLDVLRKQQEDGFCLNEFGVM